MKFYNKTSWDSNLPLRIIKFSDGEYKVQNKVDWKENITAYQLVKTSFGSTVYVMTDMAFHFVAMYFIILYYFGV